MVAEQFGPVLPVSPHGHQEPPQPGDGAALPVGGESPPCRLPGAGEWAQVVTRP